eukprot:403355675
MKLEPIKNPHSQVSQVQKKTKVEEKDDLIEKTKKQTLDKYGKKSVGKKYMQIAAAMSGSGQNFGDKDDFKLEEKVTEESQGIRLLHQGYLQSYIDFFYVTTETTPSEIEPNIKLKEEQRMNKRRGKLPFQKNQDSLLTLSDNLVQGENFLRDANIKNCFNQYIKVATQFEELNDYETASYFHKRCLDVSIDAKFIEGEAKAYKGLGICEEKVLNIFEAMNYLETALEKSIDGSLTKIEKEISKELVRVYQIIAIDFQDREEFDKSLEYFEKCLEASKRANDKDKEAECYQRIGLIHEKLGDLDKSIVFLNRFLELCMQNDNKEKAGEAHKKLAETHSKNGNISAAIKHLESLLNIAIEENKKPAQADAALKLGLLNYQEGLIKKSVDYLQRHFELLRKEEIKNQKLIDAARVNLGIAQANTQIENYKHLVLNDVNTLLTWKINRQMKK